MYLKLCWYCPFSKNKRRFRHQEKDCKNWVQVVEKLPALFLSTKLNKKPHKLHVEKEKIGSSGYQHRSEVLNFHGRSPPALKTIAIPKYR